MSNDPPISDSAKRLAEALTEALDHQRGETTEVRVARLAVDVR